MTPGRARLVALVVAATFFMEYLDGTVIVTALPAMSADFARPVVVLSIGVTAYLLTLAVFIPLSGWVADRFGTRDVFTAAIVVFTAGSILCGGCSSLGPFVAARIVQGLGGAMMVPVGRLAVLRTTEKSALTSAIALITWPALAAPLLGPPIGGFLTTYASWRWIFFLNVPVGVVAIILARHLVPNLRSEQRRRFDVPGFLLSGLALALIMEGAELVAGQGPVWSGPAMLAVGAGLGALAVRHGLRAPQPMLNMAPLAVQTFRVTVTAGTIFRISIGTIPFLLPLLFQLGFGMDAADAGVLVMATALGNISIKPLTTAILRRWGFRTVAVATGLLGAVVLVAFARLHPGTPLWWMLPLLFVGGVARSMQFTVIGTLSFADVAPAAMSSASTLASVSMQLANGLGVAIAAAILHLAAVHHGGAPNLADFHVTFLLVAALTLCGVPSFLRLPHTAGAEVSRHRVGSGRGVQPSSAGASKEAR